MDTRQQIQTIENELNTNPSTEEKFNQYLSTLIAANLESDEYNRMIDLLITSAVISESFNFLYSVAKEINITNNNHSFKSQSYGLYLVLRKAFEVSLNIPIQTS